MRAREVVVVLDDDPTGTQSATDVTVLLEWDADALAAVLASDDSVYVQTNTRALSETEAVDLVGGIRDAAREAAARLDVEVRFVLRGDSTLRGHVFAECEAIADEEAVTVFVPAFPDGGRITLGGVHQLRMDGRLVAIGDTEYAHDPVFGFSTSVLAEFVGSRSNGSAVPVGIDEVRAGSLAGILRAVPAGVVVLPDAETNADIESIAVAVRQVWADRALTVRSAAPLAAALAGVSSRRALDPSLLDGTGPVLVVCGSHTDGARRQLAVLSERVGEPTVIDTAAALADSTAEGERAAGVEAARRRPYGVRLIATDRARHHDHGGLEHGAAVMHALTTATERLAQDAGLIVTKGGITSADVIRHSLGARTARVLGQVRPGVSVWRASSADGRIHECVIVPGNMGEDDILSDAVGWALQRADAR